MKVRNGFVSNSSSSSFTCSVCDYTESGWDMCPSDFGMSRCHSGHVFCDSHITKKVEDVSTETMRAELTKIFGDSSWYADAREMLKNAGNDRDELSMLYQDYMLEDGYPESFCPTCSLGSVPDRYMLAYLLKQSGKTESELENEIKSKFGTLNELKEATK